MGDNKYTALFGIFLIVMNMWIKMDERARRPLFLGLVIILVFIYYPIKKGSQKVNYMPWYDIVMAAVGAFCFFFYPLNLEKVVSDELPQIRRRIHFSVL